jgi:hypothetical protein
VAAFEGVVIRQRPNQLARVGSLEPIVGIPIVRMVEQIRDLRGEGCPHSFSYGKGLRQAEGVYVNASPIAL